MAVIILAVWDEMRGKDLHLYTPIDWGVVDHADGISSNS
jgi:hypothetical protein